MADNYTQQQTDGGDDNTWNAKFAFQVKKVNQALCKSVNAHLTDFIIQI